MVGGGSRKKFGYTLLYQIIESSDVSKTSKGKVTETATATRSVFLVLETEDEAFVLCLAVRFGIFAIR